MPNLCARYFLEGKSRILFYRKERSTINLIAWLHGINLEFFMDLKLFKVQDV